jgi:hypothetical protein
VCAEQRALVGATDSALVREYSGIQFCVSVTSVGRGLIHGPTADSEDECPGLPRVRTPCGNFSSGRIKTVSKSAISPYPQLLTRRRCPTGSWILIRHGREFCEFRGGWNANGKVTSVRERPMGSRGNNFEHSNRDFYGRVSGGNYPEGAECQLLLFQPGFTPGKGAAAVPEPD